MTDIVLKDKLQGKENKIQRITRPEFINQLERAVSESVEDMLVTLGAVGSGTTAVLMLGVPAQLTVWGMVVIMAVSMTLLMIRIARKFDQSYTLNELAEMIQDLEQGNTERLNMILRDEGLMIPELDRE